MSDDKLTFTVTGVRGKPRPSFARGKKYTPSDYARYEQSIGAAYINSGGVKMSGPVSVAIDVFGQMPKSRPKRITSEANTYKPDADNIAKAVLDGLNGVAYDDDAQVVELHVRKLPRERIAESFLEITVKKY